MRTRVISSGVILALCGLVAVVLYYRWSRGGYEEMQTVTERVAMAIARADREALVDEPFFQDRSGTVDWLLKRSPGLAEGYEVRVRRNGAGGYHLMSEEIVTHLGEIRTPSGTLRLGYFYDRETGRLEFVTASFGTFDTLSRQ